MSQFVIPYAGNKRREIDEIFKVLDFEKEIFIEPFCGSSAISFEIHKKFPNKKFYLNDKNKELIKIYQVLKNTDYLEIEKKINDIIQTVECKEDFIKVYESYKIDNCVYKYIYLSKYSSLGRLGFYSTNDFRGTKGKSVFKFSKLNIEFISFIKSENVFITNEDWFYLWEKFKDNSSTYFIFDPPYLNSCNEFYGSKTTNVYEYFSEGINVNSKFCFILEDMWITRLLFKGYKNVDYNKKYEISKKKTKHIIYYS